MIEDTGTARGLSRLLLAAFTQIDESVELVRSRCSAGELESYLKATSKVAGAIVMDVLEPLYAKHPDLKPANWDD